LSGSSVGCGGVMIGSAGGACSGGGAGGRTGVSDGAPGGELGGFGTFMFTSSDTLCVQEIRMREARICSRRSGHGLRRLGFFRQRDEFIGVEIGEFDPPSFPVGLGLLNTILAG
jgi:hypothetical protein